MNPCRLSYITSQISWHFKREQNQANPYHDLNILDVGSGGGLLCEPLTRLGANLVGIDAAPTNIEVSKLHAEAQGLQIDYQNILAEELAQTGQKFDVVLAMEIIEHVANPSDFVKTLKSLTKPGGIIIISTLNRTAKSFAFAIIGAEYVMRWLPKGTHDWKKFITPDELSEMVQSANLELVDRSGMMYHPITQKWTLSHADFSVNYVISATRAC